MTTNLVSRVSNVGALNDFRLLLAMCPTKVLFRPLKLRQTSSTQENGTRLPRYSDIIPGVLPSSCFLFRGSIGSNDFSDRENGRASQRFPLIAFQIIQTEKLPCYLSVIHRYNLLYSDLPQRVYAYVALGEDKVCMKERNV